MDYTTIDQQACNKFPFPHSKAEAIIEEGKSSHFNPDMVDVFIDLHENFRQIALEHADFDEERETLARQVSANHPGDLRNYMKN
jgi:putative two-component system response regulator